MQWCRHMYMSMYMCKYMCKHMCKHMCMYMLRCETAGVLCTEKDAAHRQHPLQLPLDAVNRVLRR